MMPKYFSLMLEVDLHMNAAHRNICCVILFILMFRYIFIYLKQSHIFLLWIYCMPQWCSPVYFNYRTDYLSLLLPNGMLMHYSRFIPWMKDTSVPLLRTLHEINWESCIFINLTLYCFMRICMYGGRGCCRPVDLLRWVQMKETAEPAKPSGAGQSQVMTMFITSPNPYPKDTIY